MSISVSWKKLSIPVFKKYRMSSINSSSLIVSSPVAGSNSLLCVSKSSSADSASPTDASMCLAVFL